MSERNRARKSTAPNRSTTRSQYTLYVKRTESNDARNGANQTSSAQDTGLSCSSKKASKPKKSVGARAIQTYKRLMLRTKFEISKKGFHRLVAEITNRYTEPDETPYRYQLAAIIALQEATEGYLTQLFEDANLCCVHAGRVTIFPRDLNLVKRLRY